MRIIEISPKVRKKFLKLEKKNKTLLIKVLKKINQIQYCENISHYKNLRYNFRDSKRVHIKPFVLVFTEKENKIIFEEFEHHDNIYLNPTSS